MSTADPPLSATGVSLGYGIAIAVSILVLVSTIMLASYACVRIKINSNARAIGVGDNHHLHNSNSSAFNSDNSSEPMAVIMGLNEPIINSYPKMVLGESRRLPKPNNGPCSICLSDYQAKDSVRCIPECNHCFHVECVDEWLRLCGTCPLCRNSPAPSTATTPVTTPLSDLVPLASSVR